MDFDVGWCYAVRSLTGSGYFGRLKIVYTITRRGQHLPVNGNQYTLSV